MNVQHFEVCAVQQRKLEEREVFEDAGGLATEWGTAWEQPRGSQYWTERESGVTMSAVETRS